MKYIKPLALIAAAAGALYLAGCSSPSHDHSGHDHSSQGHGEKKPAEHDHGSHDSADHEAAGVTPVDVKPYALKTCIVSGEELGSMGKPIVMIHKGQQLKFCCKSCVDDFKAAPAKFLAKLNK